MHRISAKAVRAVVRPPKHLLPCTCWSSRSIASSSSLQGQGSDKPPSFERPYDFLFRDIPPLTPSVEPSSTAHSRSTSSPSITPHPRSALRSRAGTRTSNRPFNSEEDEHLGPGVSESPSQAFKPRLRETQPDLFSRPLGELQGVREAVDRAKRGRTQDERKRMSPRERAIAYELLEELPGLKSRPEMSDFRAAPEQPGEGKPSGQPVLPEDPFDFFASQDGAEIQAAQQRMAQRKASLPKSLTPEGLREEDILRQLVDEKIGEMDALGTDVELVAWMESKVFGHIAPGQNIPKERLIFPSSSPISDFDTPTIFVDGNPMPTHYTALQLSQGLGLTAPLFHTPLYPHILTHLIRRFRDSFHNPHLALHVFALARAQEAAFYLEGCTPEVYAEALETRWKCWADVEGVRKELDEMHALGVEIGPRVRKIAEAVTRAVLQDGIRAEVLAEKHFQATLELEPAADNLTPQMEVSENTVPPQVTDAMIDARRRYTKSERRAAQAIEGIVAAAIEAEDEARRAAYAAKLGSLPRSGMRSNAGTASPPPAFGRAGSEEGQGRPRTRMGGFVNRNEPPRTIPGSRFYSVQATPRETKPNEALEAVETASEVPDLTAGPSDNVEPPAPPGFTPRQLGSKTAKAQRKLQERLEREPQHDENGVVVPGKDPRAFRETQMRTRDPLGWKVSEALSRVPRIVNEDGVGVVRSKPGEAEPVEVEALGAVAKEYANSPPANLPRISSIKSSDGEAVQLITPKLGREVYKRGFSGGLNSSLAENSTLRNRRDRRATRNPVDSRMTPWLPMDLPDLPTPTLPTHIKLEEHDPVLSPEDDEKRMQIYAADSKSVYSSAAQEFEDVQAFKHSLLAVKKERLNQPEVKKEMEKWEWWQRTQERAVRKKDQEEGIVRRPEPGLIPWELKLKKEKSYKDQGHPLLKWKKTYEEFERRKGRRPDA